MPNYCDNEVRIGFDNEEHAREFIDKCCVPWPEDKKLPSLDNPSNERPVYFSFTKTLPLNKLTKDGSDWEYNVAVDTWGTKWDIGPDDQDPLMPSEIIRDLQVYTSFCTAWTPPEGVHRQLVKMGFTDIFWFFREDGVEFAGYL